MFKLIHKIIGFKTKDLYLAEQGELDMVYVGGQGIYATFLFVCRSFEPAEYIICRKKSNEYIDIFTKVKYKKLGDNFYDDGKLLVKNLEPIGLNKHRIKYKDAEKILEEKNTLYLKKEKE